MIINRLPLLMKEKGVSIRQLSRETGITYTTIRAVYHGQRRSVQLDVLDAICQTLKVQPGDIYGHTPSGEQLTEIAEEPPGPSESPPAADRGSAPPVNRDPERGWRNW